MVSSFGPDLVRFPLREGPVPDSELERLPLDLGDAISAIATSWSPDGRRLGGSLQGDNGQLLGGILLYDLSTSETRFLPIDLAIPLAGSAIPTLSWLPNSRRGILRWGDRLLVVDAETEEISTLAEGFHRDGGVARLSADGRWIYMLDAIEEGDVWVASRASESQASE